MNVTFACPQCDQTSRQDFGPGVGQVVCSSCQHVIAVSAGPGGRETTRAESTGQGSTVAGSPEGADLISRCLICGCNELYVRKDFSQRLGLAIVVTGILLSSIAWGFHMRYTTYGILFATALIDVVLYFTVNNMLQCYRCRAEYRGLPDLAGREPFNLETHEKFRQQAARLSDAQATNAQALQNGTLAAESPSTEAAPSSTPHR